MGIGQLETTRLGNNLPIFSLPCSPEDKTPTLLYGVRGKANINVGLHENEIAKVNFWKVEVPVMLLYACEKYILHCFINHKPKVL